MGVLEENFSRVSYAVVTTLVQVHLKKIINQANNWQTFTLVFFGTIFSVFLDIKIKSIRPGRCSAVKTALSMVLMLGQIMLAFLMGISVVGIFLEEDIANDPSLDSVYKPIIFMVSMAVLLALLSIFDLFNTLSEHSNKP